MSRLLESLDREWSRLATSPQARGALVRWANDHPALAGEHDLAQILKRRRDAERGPQILRALAALAPSDDLAARTLLQALIPGIVRLACTAGNDDPAAIDELVSHAWERIRTYPTTRNGSVAGNVLLDTRKRYLRHRGVGTPDGSAHELTDVIDEVPSPEDEVLGRLLVAQLAGAQRGGIISRCAFHTIIRTRLRDEAIADVAADEQLPPAALASRRWRAERRLRELPLAG